jgi:hypothetical protein
VASCCWVCDGEHRGPRHHGDLHPPRTQGAAVRRALEEFAQRRSRAREADDVGEDLDAIESEMLQDLEQLGYCGAALAKNHKLAKKLSAEQVDVLTSGRNTREYRDALGSVIELGGPGPNKKQVRARAMLVTLVSLPLVRTALHKGNPYAAVRHMHAAISNPLWPDAALARLRLRRRRAIVNETIKKKRDAKADRDAKRYARFLELLEKGIEERKQYRDAHADAVKTLAGEENVSPVRIRRFVLEYEATHSTLR